MRRSAAVASVVIALVVVGCSGDPTVSDEYQTLQDEYDSLAGAMDGVDQMRQQLLYERDDLDAANQALEQELAATIAELDTVTAADPTEACAAELARCDELLTVSGDALEEWPPSTPAVWQPSYSGYRTPDATVIVIVYAPNASTVTVNGVDAEARLPNFVAEASLVEGDNIITIVADDQTIEILVVHDTGLERRYGRVLDSYAEWDAVAGTDEFLGVDYGEMDLQPDYGQGDFDAGDVIVEFSQLTAATPLVVDSAFSSRVVLTDPAEIVDYFTYESPPTDVWNVLLDGDTIIQIEGPVPLGD